LGSVYSPPLPAAPFTTPGLLLRPVPPADWIRPMPAPSWPYLLSRHHWIRDPARCRYSRPLSSLLLFSRALLFVVLLGPLLLLLMLCFRMAVALLPGVEEPRTKP